MNAPGGGPARYLDHVGIVVADADAAARRFSVAFGLALVHDEVIDELGVRLVYLAGADRTSPSTIQLVQPLRAGAIKDHLDAHGEGVHHVCLAVRDLDAAVSAVNEADSAAIFNGGLGRRACFLAERSCGTLIELVEIGPAAQERRTL